MLFHHKLRSSSFLSPLFCYFHDGHAPFSLDCDDGGHPCKVRTAALELPLLEIRYSCCSLIARIGRWRWRLGHAAVAAAASSEFGYDLMSYVLNFEDDWSRESDEEFLVRNFSARLPQSPDRLLPVNS